MTKRETIAVVIPTKNVAHFFRPTLESIRWCDEVIVIDMFSTDETKKMAQEYSNVRFFEREDVIYGNVNFGIEQANSDWILRLDSDEIVTEKFKNEIETRVLENPDNPYDGFDAQQEAYFMGYLLTQGFGNDNWRSTLFRKGKASYLMRSEHEDMVKNGPWSRLNERYQHFTNPTISNWVNKINYYTDKDIARWNVQDEKITFPKIIYRTLRWFQRYYTFPHKAYKDGAPGFAVALLATCGMMIHYLKQWEKQERSIRGEDSFPDHPNA